MKHARPLNAWSSLLAALHHYRLVLLLLKYYFAVAVYHSIPSHAAKVYRQG